MPDVSLVYGTGSGDTYPYILIGDSNSEWNFVYVALVEDIANSQHANSLSSNKERTGWTITVSSSNKTGTATNGI